MRFFIRLQKETDTRAHKEHSLTLRCPPHCDPTPVLAAYLLLCGVPVCAQRGTSVTCTIPSTADPWEEALHPGCDPGIHDHTGLVVIHTSSSLACTPGATIPMPYVSGLVSAGIGYACQDANGEQDSPTDDYNSVHGRVLHYSVSPCRPLPETKSPRLEMPHTAKPRARAS
jgi:hypothetical protein